MDMNFFVENSNLTGTAQQQFAEWLVQYDAELTVNQSFDEHPEFSNTAGFTEDISKLPRFSLDWEHRPAPGQIRLLDNECSRDPERTIPILLLTQWSNDQWLIVPFSRFLTPASTGEFSTDLEFYRYKVVEVWNSAVVSDLFLYQHSVFLRDGGEDLRIKGCQLFFHLLASDPLPEELQKKIGPEIQAAWDPRIQYLLDEKEELAPLRELSCRLNEQFRKYTAELEDKNKSFELAAGPEDGAMVFFAAEGHSALLCSALAENELRLKVCSADKKSSSTEFDDFLILSIQGEILGKIEKSRCRILNFKGGFKDFILSTADGSILMLRKVEK